MDRRREPTKRSGADAAIVRHSREGGARISVRDEPLDVVVPSAQVGIIGPMRRWPPSHWLNRERATLAVSTVTLVLGCTTKVNELPSPPTNGTYHIAFPSTAAAVAVDTLQMFVFDSTTAGNDCTSLVVARRSGADLPAVITQTAPTPLCDVFSGTKGLLGEDEGLAYGGLSLLVAAQRGGKDLFIGCAITNLSASSPPVEVTMAPVGLEALPRTTCQNVSAHCAKTCPSQ